MATELWLPLAFVALMVVPGLFAGWLLGLTNPMGYMGVLPWRVPACTCRRGRAAFGHESECEITRRAPR